MAHDVFISYAQHDKPTADALCHGLESAGVRCWIAPRDVPAGSNWKTQLVEAIRSARLMLLVFSSEADRSPQVMREVDIAFESGRPIVPFRIEDVKMNDEMYYCIAARHWLDALTPPVEDHVNRLVADVRAILSAQDTVTAGARDPAPPPARVADVAAPAAQVAPAPSTVPAAVNPSPAPVRARPVALWVAGLCVAVAVVVAFHALRGWIGVTDSWVVGGVVIALGLLVFSVRARSRRPG